MADRPIPFSAPMVRALIAGRKTQTRRVLNPQPVRLEGMGCCLRFYDQKGYLRGDASPNLLSDGSCPAAIFAPYVVGDRLYVREEYYQQGYWKPTPPRIPGTTGREKWSFVPEGDPTFDAPAEFRRARWCTDPWTIAWHKRLGRFMPRVYSRMTLIVTDVRVERLQDISEADAIAEGIRSGPIDGYWRDAGNPTTSYSNPTWAYVSLWEVINGPGAWDANPWVVAITFEVRQGNIDQIAL